MSSWAKAKDLYTSSGCIQILLFVQDDMANGLLSQAKAIRHHTHATERHRRSPYHRIEQESANGIQDSCRNGHTDEVVKECPEEVLTDGADSELRKANGFWNLY